MRPSQSFLRLWVCVVWMLWNQGCECIAASHRGALQNCSSARSHTVRWQARDHQNWEIKSFNPGQKQTLHIDPRG